jgi:hypothetical protein
MYGACIFCLPRQLYPTKKIPTAKMPKTISKQREIDLTEAMLEFKAGNFRSIRSAASAYGLPYTTLRDRLRGAQSRQEAHRNQQLLTMEEEKALVRFCIKLDDLGHPLNMSIFKRLAVGMLSASRRREVGIHWTNRFLKRNPAVVAKFSQRLDRQRATASDLGKAALGAFADTALQAEMVREVRADAKRPSIKAVQDRRQLTKARVIDQNDVIRLREEREGRDAQKQARIPRSRQQPSTVSSSSTVPVTPSKRSQKRVLISKKVTVNLVDPENAFLEDGWDTDREIEAEKEASEEEFIDIEDILALPTPTARGKNGKDVNSRPPVITRSGRVVKVVDKDNL